MRQSRRGRSPPRTSSSASDRLGRRGHGGDAGSGVPHAGDADWCSAPPDGGWRDAQHWQRRVGGVAPADVKVGTGRGGDATTAHGRGGTRPAAFLTRRCGRRCGDRDVSGRRRERLPPPRIDSAVAVTAAMPVLAYPTRGTPIGAQRLPPWEWRDDQHWQRRVGGVAPADDKVGKRRGGDATTAHRACQLRRSGASAPSCGSESMGVRRRRAGTPEPIVSVEESPAGRRPHADAVPAGAVGVSPVGRCPFSARWLSAAMARLHWRRRHRGREMCEAASPGPGGASCRLRCSQAPRSALRQWGAAFFPAGGALRGSESVGRCP